MGKHTNNVIQFPGTPKPVSADSVIKRMPADIVPFLAGKPSNHDVDEHGGGAYPDGEFVKLSVLRTSDFNVANKSEVADEAEVLDKYLDALADRVGELAVKKLAHAINSYVEVVADVSFAEGLAEGFLVEDDDPNV